MTRNEILTMDGPQLVLAAFQLGLAPAGALVTSGGRVIFAHAYWMPHEDVAQARQVFFDFLPTLGDFDTERNDYQTHAWCEVFSHGHSTVARHWKTKNPENTDRDATEALALLRCACLAMVAQQRTGGER